MITLTPKKDKSIFGRHTKPAPKQRLHFFGAGRKTTHNTPRNRKPRTLKAREW